MSDEDDDNMSFKTCTERTPFSESEVSTYKNDEDDRLTSHVLRFEWEIFSLKKRVYQLELERKTDLTQDDLQKLSTKRMLQKLDGFD